MRRGAESGQTRSCERAIAISRFLRLQFPGRQSLDLGLVPNQALPGFRILPKGAGAQIAGAVVGSWEA
jgi:hypothetical protein